MTIDANDAEICNAEPRLLCLNQCFRFEYHYTIDKLRIN